MKIIIQAIPFCFGPASHALVIAHALRRRMRDDVELVVLATGTAWELLNGEKVFNSCYKYSTVEEASTCLSQKFLEDADAVLSVGDFDFIRNIHRGRIKIFMVDALLWMWDTLPQEIRLCSRYFAVDFPGVKQRVESELPNLLAHESIALVNPICEQTGINMCERTVSGIIVVNFGGMQSPLGHNLALAEAMTSEILNAVNAVRPEIPVRIRGGGQPIEALDAKFAGALPDLRIGPLQAETFLEELYHGGMLFTVPGLSIVFEAIRFAKSTVFLFPLNYSQHAQVAAYEQMLAGASYILPKDFPGLGMVPEGLPEAEGVARAIEIGKRFCADRRLRTLFRERIEGQLRCFSREPLIIQHWPGQKQCPPFDGAEQIAQKIMVDIAQKAATVA